MTLAGYRRARGMGAMLHRILSRLAAYLAVVVAAGLLFLAGASVYALMWPKPVVPFVQMGRYRPNSRSPGPPTGDRHAALLVITVDLYLITHAVYAIRIGTGKGVHGGAVLGVNHEYAAHGSLAVISNECARSHNVDIVVDGVIQMNAVGAIEFGPCGQHVRLVDGVNDEEHSRSLPDGS